MLLTLKINLQNKEFFAKCSRELTDIATFLRFYISGTKKDEAKRCDGEMKNEKRSESESKKEEKTSNGLSDCSKQALDLSSTSVILFEEVIHSYYIFLFMITY